jgi:hypothetical protein
MSVKSMDHSSSSSRSLYDLVNFLSYSSIKNFVDLLQRCILVAHQVSQNDKSVGSKVLNHIPWERMQGESVQFLENQELLQI